MTATNPYTVLGIAEEASADEISSAYRRLAREYHPDATGGDAKKAEHFKKIADAYRDLRDPWRRGQVDNRLRDDKARAKAGRRPIVHHPAARSTPPQCSGSPAPARKTDIGLQAARASTTRAKPSTALFTDFASTLAKARPMSEGLGWLAAGVAADLLFAMAGKRGK